MPDKVRPLSRPNAAIIGVAVAAYATWLILSSELPAADTDVTQLWYAAKALLAGQNPYAVIGPGREYEWRWPLYYPLTAVLPFVPLAGLPLVFSHLAITALPSGVLAYLVARNDPRALVMFLSRAFYVNVVYAQWMPLLLCALYIPWLGFVLAGKPTLGAGMMAGYRHRKDVLIALATGGAAVAIALLIRPDWIQAWLSAIESADHIRPWIVIPGGFLVLTALIHWRHWQARLLVALALVPQTWNTLAVLPLVMLPRSLAGKATVAALTFVPSLLVVRPPFSDRMQGATFFEITTIVGEITFWAVWVPTLSFVLWEYRRERNPFATQIQGDG